MLKRLFHWLVARPAVYDLVQILVGARKVRRRIGRRMGDLGRPGLVVDVGGGTGAARDLVPPSSAYLCLDLDPVKIKGFLRKNPGHWAVVADAARMPLADASMDAVLCILVAHHLPDEVFARFLAEARRVLRPEGKLLFVDPVWRRWRLPGRLLWRYDRGDYPRTREVLKAALASEFDLSHWEQFSLLHSYVLAVARRRDPKRSPGSRVERGSEREGEHAPSEFRAAEAPPVPRQATR